MAEPLSAGLIMIERYLWSYLSPWRSDLVKFCGNGLSTLTLASSNSLTIVMPMTACGGLLFWSNLDRTLNFSCRKCRV